MVWRSQRKGAAPAVADVVPDVLSVDAAQKPTHTIRLGQACNKEL